MFLTLPILGFFEPILALRVIPTNWGKLRDSFHVFLDSMTYSYIVSSEVRKQITNGGKPPKARSASRLPEAKVFKALGFGQVPERARLEGDDLR